MNSNVYTQQKNKTMFKDVNKREIEDLKKLMESAEKIVWNEKIPVIIFVESENEKLKSDVIKSIISCFETITYNVVFPYNKKNNDIHFMVKYWRDISEKGKIKLFYNSPYNEVITSKLKKSISHHEFENQIRQLNIFERQLSDDGYVIVKLFLHTTNDNSNSTKYEYIKTADKILEETSTKNCPWYILNCENKNVCILNVYNSIINSIKQKNHNTDANVVRHTIAKPYIYDFNTGKSLSLCDIKQENLQLTDDYKTELLKQQKIFLDYVKKLKSRKISLVIGFEGWDASGKGGNIKRITKPLDPLDYKVVPVPAPTKDELSKHYLWRFYNNIADKGKVTLFDRTWYGRVLVERVEKLTPENRCKEAYREINEFEKQLYDNKTIIVKFWLQIDKDEQLERFKARQQDLDRKWKICDDDWRNRDKWGEYEKCVDEMIKNTSTDFAPWNVVCANDKKYGRIKCLKIINKTIKTYLAQ